MNGSSEIVQASWSLVDLILLLGLGVSVVVGIWRGFLKEVMALAGWLVAYFMAQWFGPQGGHLVPVGEPGSRLNVLGGMLVVFVLSWLCWALLTWAVIQVVRESGLGGTDRMLGGGFGLIRGLVVALAVVTLVSMTPLVEWQPWKDSRGVGYLSALLDGLRPILPEQVVRFLPAQP
ncbi:MAG TPA: CvpA family protein [Aquabacterium sp.]|nr:CvpA family protein [Aquabacterium sp.]